MAAKTKTKIAWKANFSSMEYPSDQPKINPPVFWQIDYVSYRKGSGGKITIFMADYIAILDAIVVARISSGVEICGSM